MAASADKEVSATVPEPVSGEPESAAEPAAETGLDAEPAGDEEEYEPEPLSIDIEAELVTEISETYEAEYTTLTVPLSPEAEEEAVGDYGLTDDDDEGDLVITETLAEIYATQGLYERAAAVYRRLLRQRPGDERLEARLRELERTPAWGGSTAPAEPESGAPLTLTDTGAGEGWLERVESAWTGGEGAVSAEESPYSWTGEQRGEEAAGQLVGDYFRALLAWRPGEASGPTATAEPVGGTVDADPASSFDQWFGAQAAETERRAHPTEAGRTAGTGEGDEDLEMFRSWLKSLKK
jgi:hypothetical protein